MYSIESHTIIFEHRLFTKLAYAFDCTFCRPIFLTAKALRRITMRGFLVGANEPAKRTLKCVQLRLPDFKG